MATAVRRVTRRKPEGVTASNPTLMAWVQQHVDAKTRAAEATARVEELKARLMELLVAAPGYQDEKGSYYIDLPEPVGKFSKIKRERRVSQRINEERALELLESKGLLDKYMVWVRTVDLEALGTAVWDDAVPVSEDEFRALVDVKETWAFVTE